MVNLLEILPDLVLELLAELDFFVGEFLGFLILLVIGALLAFVTCAAVGDG